MFPALDKLRDVVFVSKAVIVLWSEGRDSAAGGAVGVVSTVEGTVGGGIAAVALSSALEQLRHAATAAFAGRALVAIVVERRRLVAVAAALWRIVTRLALGLGFAVRAWLALRARWWCARWAAIVATVRVVIQPKERGKDYCFHPITESNPIYLFLLVETSYSAPLSILSWIGHAVGNNTIASIESRIRNPKHFSGRLA